jgi:hypothetical protein
MQVSIPNVESILEGGRKFTRKAGTRSALLQLCSGTRVSLNFGAVRVTVGHDLHLFGPHDLISYSNMKQNKIKSLIYRNSINKRLRRPTIRFLRSTALIYMCL